MADLKIIEYTLEDYIILRTESRKEMKQKVINFGEKGFIPQGGVAVVIEEEKTIFYQAILKRN
jgi:hypothetical protein